MPFVDAGSLLIRNKWMMNGLIQKASKSFWTALTGSSQDSIVFQTRDLSAKEGHTVIFDYDGNLSGKVFKDKQTAYGKGEQKKKFSDALTVKRVRIPVDNGDSFDGVDIGDLSITQHSDSRDKLSDLWPRIKDQFLFDSMQGNLGLGAGQPSSHVIDLGGIGTFDYDALLAIEQTVKTSVGYTTGSVRRPLVPFRLSKGQPVWMLIIDSMMALTLKRSSGYQNIVIQADVRGNDNRAIQGVIGKIGNLLIVEADQFFGTTSVLSSPWDLNASSVDIAGLRQTDVNGKWTGHPDFDYTSDLFSYGAVVGAGALMLGYGKLPDYKFQESQDFGITSESALESWLNIRKTKLVAETEDYDSGAKVSGIDWGVVTVKTQVQ